MQLELGGKLRGLKFNIGTLNYIQEIMAIDPFEYQAQSTSYKDLLPYAINIIHAALLSNCQSKGEEPDFTHADIVAWVNEHDLATLTEIIQRYSAIMSSPKSQANGEVGADTQPINV